MTLYALISQAADQNDDQSAKWALQANEVHPALVENYFRVQRLALLAPSLGTEADVVERISRLTRDRVGNLSDLRGDIDAFNKAVRQAHAEMLASR